MQCDVEAEVRSVVIRDFHVRADAKALLGRLGYFTSQRTYSLSMMNEQTCGMSVLCRRKLISAINDLKRADVGLAFHLPPLRLGETYPKRVGSPVDLHTITIKVYAGVYRDAAQFLEDVQRIARNCETFNGRDNELTSVANKLVTMLPALLKDI